MADKKNVIQVAEQLFYAANKDIDSKKQIASLSDIKNITFPYVGMLFYTESDHTWRIVDSLTDGYLNYNDGKFYPTEPNGLEFENWEKVPNLYVGTYSNFMATDGIDGTDGDDGTDGQSVVTSFIFKRSATMPTTPSGGSFSSPVPSGWSDGIPAELNGMPLWMSSRVMTSDGLAPQQATWSTPVLAADTATIDFEWTDSTANDVGTPSAPLNGAVWTNESSINSVWMAVRKIENGLPKEWNVSKIKGEKGADGVTSFTWVKYSLYENGRDTSGTVRIFDEAYTTVNSVKTYMTYMGIAYNKTTNLESNNPDDYTWIKIKGEDVYTLDLSNDNVSVPASSTGVIVNPETTLLNAKTTIQLYFGQNIVPISDYTIVETVTSGLTFTKDTATNTYSVTGLTTPTGAIAFKAYKKDSSGNTDTSVVLASGTFSISKINGTSVYEIIPSSNVIKVSGENSLFPTTISAKVLVNNAGVTSYTTQGKLTYRYVRPTDADTQSDGIQFTIGSNLTIENSDDYEFLELQYFHPTTGDLVDRERIPFVRNGKSAKYEETRFAKSTSVSTAPALVASDANPVGWTVAPPTISTTETLWMTKSVKNSDGTLFANWSTPVRMSGAQGINGTSGASPRLLEFVANESYENGGVYIDYAYYRSNDVNEGWYTVKVVNGARTTAVYTGGIPDPTKFDKAPFTKEMSFGNVIAEQANLAGFLFRNQILQSQTSTLTSDTHITPNTLLPNLMLDGIQGVIKILDKLVLDKNGIVLKDDAGRPRIKMQWIDGVPALHFLNENGVTTWVAGTSGSVTYTEARSDSYSSYKGLLLSGVSTSVTPIDTDIPSTIWREVACSTYDGGIMGFDSFEPSVVGYGFTIGSPSSAPVGANGKIYTTKDYNGVMIADGWYVTNAYSYNGVSTSDFRGVVELDKIVGGKVVGGTTVIVPDITMVGVIWACGTHMTPTYP